LTPSTAMACRMRRGNHLIRTYAEMRTRNHDGVIELP
jgi:hypothetical protein